MENENTLTPGLKAVDEARFSRQASFCLCPVSRALLLSGALLAALGCERAPEQPEPVFPVDPAGIYIPAGQVPLYAELSNYNLLPARPRTKADEAPVCLESLLDRKQQKTIRFKGARMTLTPFRQNAEAVLASFGDTPDSSLASATCVKKYYIESAKGAYRGAFVATMVTSRQYDALHPDFDYFTMPDYTGAILYASPEGKLNEVRIYTSGLITHSAPVLPGWDVPDSSELVFVTLGEGTSQTRGGENVITAAICIGFSVPTIPGGWINPSWCFGTLWSTAGGAGGTSNPCLTTTHAPGTGSFAGSVEDDFVLENLPPAGVEYIVDLTSNLPDEVEMLGIGTYPAGSKVSVGYKPTALVYEIPEFSRWTGTFEDRKECSFLYTALEDVNATAYFGDDAPCSDVGKGVTNPLKEMKIAPTRSGKYASGLFNALRHREDNSTYYHQGVDFYAREGTPVYAMYSGTVTRVFNSAPDRYSTDWDAAGGFGNIIVIESEVFFDAEKTTGAKLSLQYSHLLYGTPVAVNWRTGVPYQVGDTVYRGDLIGYTGRTGNAYYEKKVPNPHLHLGASLSADAKGRIPTDSWIDAVPYINGSVDRANIESKEGNVENIKCD